MQAGMGEKVGHVIHHGATCGFALAFGFVKCWPLALIVLSMMPLLAGSGAALGKVISRMSETVPGGVCAGGDGGDAGDGEHSYRARV